jgi:hypothetical protein
MQMAQQLARHGELQAPEVLLEKLGWGPDRYRGVYVYAADDRRGHRLERMCGADQLCERATSDGL